MRIVCIHPARDAIACLHGTARLGTATDNDIVLAGAGTAPHHVTIVADARGLVMDVAPGCQRVYVNARAVRERALLHYGDTITLGGSKVRVVADAAPPDPGPSAAGGPVEAIRTVVLRIVSGSESGRALTVSPELHLGAGSAHFGELDFHCRIAQAADGILLEADNAKPRVNGWNCRRARLAAGDQVALGDHRLVVEAPAASPTPAVAEPASIVAPAGEAETDDGAGSHVAIWWLILAAAILAAGIASALYFAG